jgi:hypothetical protein
MPARTRVAQLMAEQEGFGLPGTIPSERNNPLDLKHGPNALHRLGAPDDIGWYASVSLGWQDGERQLELWAGRGFTIRRAIEEQTGWTPKKGDVEGNNTAEYVEFVCRGLGLGPDGAGPDTPLRNALKIPAI